MPRLTKSQLQTSLTSLDLKRKLESVRLDTSLTKSEKIAQKRFLWAQYESKFSVKG